LKGACFDTGSSVRPVTLQQSYASIGQKKLKAMIALLAMFPRFALVEALWPESEGENAKHAFESTCPV